MLGSSIKRPIVFLLFALTAWLIPTPIRAVEKAELVFPKGQIIILVPQLPYGPSLPELTKPVAPRKPTRKFNPCNCWSYVKSVRGNNMPQGYGAAKNYPVWSHEPSVGAIVLTYEGPLGHMGIVRAVTDTHIQVEDYNFARCQRTVRDLALDSPLIKGYIP